MAATRFGDYKLILRQGEQSVLYNIENQWKLNIKKLSWIEPEEWNMVNRMIYEDLMNNKPAGRDARGFKGFEIKRFL